ncbi:tetratricopeptide repeat protein [Comamonas sp. C24C]
MDKPGVNGIATSGAPLGSSTAVDQRQLTLQWYAQQAEKGDAEAQNNLGLAYANGDGVPQDYIQAVQWFRKAADQGVALAQYCLGVSYRDAQGVPQDSAQASYWFRKAAEQGNVYA